MLQLCFKSLAACALALTLFSNAYAITIYSETDDGDLSGDGLTPTVITTLGYGSNRILGTTGQTAGVSDRDYFVITVPDGFQLVQLIEEAGTEAGQSQPGGTPRGFIAVESGSQVTIPLSPPPTSAAGLLGWTHYNPTAVDIDILPAMGLSGNQADGFIPPLGPGTYAFWIQDTTVGEFNYGFNFVVPEPSSGALLLMGCAALLGFRRRRNS